jgi:hypothetical protein
MAQMSARELRLKGQAFKGIFWALQQRHGVAVYEQVVGGLPDEFRNAVRYGELVAGGWYPIAWYREMYESIGRVVGRSPEVPRELSRIAVKQDLNAVYRFVLSFVSPDLMLANWQRVWSLYCDGGRLVVQQPSNREMHLEFTGCFGHDRIIWQDVTGGIEAILEVCKGKDPKVKLVTCGPPSEGTATVHCAWK